MNDVFIDCGHTEIEVVDPDAIIKSVAPEKRHAVRFATSPNNWVTVPLTDKELTTLGDLVHARWEEKVFYGNLQANRRRA
jgi:hypothetical protein